MKFILFTILSALSCISLNADPKEKQSKAPIAPEKPIMKELVKSIGFEVLGTDTSKYYVADEKLDRTFYKPITFESARIRSLTAKRPDKHKDKMRGHYYLSIETYHTDEEATKRAQEYKDLSRLAKAPQTTTYKLDTSDYSKRTVRCWGFSSGKRAYLLTTHASVFSYLERRTQSVINGVKKYEKKMENP